LTLVNCRLTTGSIKQTKRNWQFLGKFVYQTHIPNIMNYTIVTSNTHMRALLYFWDNPDRKLVGANFYSDFDRFVAGEIDCANFSSRTIKGGSRAVVSGVPGVFRPSSDARPYFWFLAVSDCSGETLNIESFEIRFQQTNGSLIHKEFSWDEWGIFPATGVFMVFYIIIFIVHLFSSFQLYKIEAYHSIMKLYTLGVALQLGSLVCLFFHYSIYAHDGFGSPGLDAIGTLIGMGSQLVLLFLCILIAKGWAITTSYITQKYLLLAITALLVLIFLTLFFWSEFLLDPMFSLYTYNTPPGILILSIRFLLVFWFLWCLRDTLRSETNPEKRKFYIPFAIFYGFWIISLPVSALLLSSVVTWSRLKIVTIVVLICDLIGFSILGYLFWHTRAREYFSIRSSALLSKNSNSSLIKDGNL